MSTLLVPPQRPSNRRQMSLQPIPRSTPYTHPSAPPKRPGAPRRSHSFCGFGKTSTYALASTSSAAHLSKDKRFLVAPPLERTVSSIGHQGNFSAVQRMERPLPRAEGLARTGSDTGSQDQTVTLESTMKAMASSPPAVPTILVHPTSSPQRPKFSARGSASTESSRESSPTTPSGPSIIYEPTSQVLTKENVEEVVEGVTELSL